MKKNWMFAIFFIFIIANIFAETFTVMDVEFDLPIDIYNLVKGKEADIEKKCNEYGIEKDALESAKGTALKELNEFYNSKGENYAPITKSLDGLDSFSENLAKSNPGVQFTQNVWAEAWIGKFLPTGGIEKIKDAFHVGAGVNVGVSQLRIGGFKDAAAELDIDISSIPDDLVFPTIAADFRIGGFILPFDIGFNVMKLDSTNISALDNAISPVAFDFFTFGIDARYAILKGNGWLPKVSAGIGYSINKGNVFAENDSSKIAMDFETSNFYLQSQISKKLLFFVPFAGFKLGFTNSTVNWSAQGDWDSIFDINEKIDGHSLQELGILPTKITGGFEGFKCIPQAFLGFGLDFYVGHFTIFGGYDFSNQLLSAGFNFRFAW